MSADTKTLRQLIDELNAKHVVPARYLQHLYEMFETRGISLSSDATPLTELLSASFRFQAEAHQVSQVVKRDMEQMREGLAMLEQRCRRIAELARRVENGLVEAQATKKQTNKPAAVINIFRPGLLPN